MTAVTAIVRTLDDRERILCPQWKRTMVLDLYLVLVVNNCYLFRNWDLFRCTRHNEITKFQIVWTKPNYVLFIYILTQEPQILQRSKCTLQQTIPRNHLRRTCDLISSIKRRK